MEKDNIEIAIIFWKDACMNGSDSVHINDVKDLGLMDLVSVGIILYEDDESISLGTDFCHRYQNVRDVNVYPKSGIEKIIRRTLIQLSASQDTVKPDEPNREPTDEDYKWAIDESKEEGK